MAIERQIQSQPQEARAAIDQTESGKIQKLHIATQKGVITEGRDSGGTALATKIIWALFYHAIRPADCSYMCTKEDVPDRLSKTVSQRMPYEFNSVENAKINYKGNLHVCSTAGIYIGSLDCLFLHEKCQLTSHRSML